MLIRVLERIRAQLALLINGDNLSAAAVRSFIQLFR